MAKDPPTSMPRSFAIQGKPNADGWNHPLLQAMSFHSCGPGEALHLGKVFQDNWLLRNEINPFVQSTWTCECCSSLLTEYSFQKMARDPSPSKERDNNSVIERRRLAFPGKPQPCLNFHTRAPPSLRTLAAS